MWQVFEIFSYSKKQKLIEEFLEQQDAITFAYNHNRNTQPESSNYVVKEK